jgi:hypothetical protein
MYIKRTIEKSIERANKFFPVVLVTGPRQVGKTTVLQNCETQPRTYVSLDTLENRELAKNDPTLFLQRYPAPVLIDEIQYAPELFPYIKASVDKEKKSGMYWLTGSQQFHLMKNVSESLAGRVGILQLEGLSQDEKNGHPDVPPFLPTEEYIKTKVHSAAETDLLKIYELIWKGSYPKLYPADSDYWAVFYESYMQTYIERDIKALSAVGNELDFVKFMRALAARTGEMLNYSELANNVGVSQPTIKSWLSILQASGLVYILRPYYNNVGNRFIKTPKVYFMDTGLACYLTGWKTPEVLESGAMSGNMFETYVVSEIIKSYWHNGKQPDIYHYRDKDKREIDVLLHENGTLYPIEIKKKSNPDKGDIKAFNVIETLKQKRGSGAVVCMALTHLPLTDDVNIIPVGYL